MARSLGRLTLDLIARTGSFNRNLDDAAKRVRGTARDIDRSAQAINRFVLAAGAAGVAFVSSMTTIAVATSKTMDEMRKMAQATGLSVEALSELTYVASQSGLEQQTLINALGRLSKGIGDAARDTGDAKRAFDTLGISIRDSSGRLRDADKVLVDFAEEMSKLPDGTQKTALAMQVFGRAGAQLVPLLNNGREGIKALTDEARRFGIVLDTDVAKQAERFNDNLTRLGAVKQGLAYTITEALLPALESITDILVDVTAGLAGSGELIETAFKVAGGAAITVAAIFTGRLVASLVASTAAFVAASIEAGRYQATLARMAGVSATAAAGLGALTVAARAASVLLAVLGGPVGLIAAVGAAGAAFLTMGRSARSASADTELLSRSLEGLTERQLIHEQNQLGDAIERAGKRMVDARKEVEALESRLAHAENAWIRSSQAINDLRKKLDEARANSDKAGQEFDRLTARSTEVARAIWGVRNEVDGLNQALGQIDTEAVRAEWMGKYATQSERLTAELDKAREAFGGMIPPDIEARIRGAFTPARSGAAATTSELQNLIKQFDQQVAVLGMTEAQAERYRIETAKGTDADRARALALYDQIEAWKETDRVINQAAESARYIAAINQELEVFGQQKALDVAGVGMGDRLREQMEEEFAIRQEYAQRRRELEEQQQIESLALDDEQYEARLEALQRSEDEHLRILQESNEAKLEAQADWKNGAIAALQNFADEAADIAGQVESILMGAFKGVEDAIVDLVKTGKLDLRGLLASIAEDVLRMMIRVGLSMAANALLGETLAASATAVSVAMGKVTAAAWAPAAAMASLASFGANAAPAMAGITATTGLATSLAVVGMAHDGIDEVPKTGTWLLEKGERVVTADTSARLDSVLDRIDSGGGGGVTVNLIEDPTRAGQVESRTDDDGAEQVDIFVADIQGDGPRSQAIQNAFGLSRVGT